jgi:hypothetical protein
VGNIRHPELIRTVRFDVLCQVRLHRVTVTAVCRLDHTPLWPAHFKPIFSQYFGEAISPNRPHFQHSLESLDQGPQVVAAYLRHFLANGFYNVNQPRKVCSAFLISFFVPVIRLARMVIDCTESR